MAASSQTGTTQFPRSEDKQYRFGVTILTLRVVCPPDFPLLHTTGIRNAGCCLFVYISN